jgi:hypothetical protein
VVVVEAEVEVAGGEVRVKDMVVGEGEPALRMRDH